MQCFATMPGIPGGPEEVVGEWRCQQKRGKSHESFAERAADLMAKIELVRDTAPSEDLGHAWDEDEVRMLLDGGEGSCSWTGSFKAAARLHQALCEAPHWADLCGILAGSHQEAVQLCARSLGLSALATGPGKVDGNTADTSKLAGYMKGFFCQDDVSAAVAACGKFSQAQSRSGLAPRHCS